jgi:hypothetical protein
MKTTNNDLVRKVILEEAEKRPLKKEEIRYLLNTNSPSTKDNNINQKPEPSKYLSATDKWELYKKVASPEDKKELLEIEEKNKPMKEQQSYKSKMAKLNEITSSTLKFLRENPLPDLDSLKQTNVEDKQDKPQGLGHLSNRVWKLKK